MSADSFHALVEKRMKQAGDIFDYQDFTELIGSIGAPLSMDDDFYQFENEKNVQQEGELTKTWWRGGG